MFESNSKAICTIFQCRNDFCLRYVRQKGVPRVICKSRHSSDIRITLKSFLKSDLVADDGMKSATLKM